MNDILTIEGNKITRRRVDVFENKSCNLVMFYGDFKNIQTIRNLQTTNLPILLVELLNFLI